MTYIRGRSFDAEGENCKDQARIRFILVPVEPNARHLVWKWTVVSEEPGPLPPKGEFNTRADAVAKLRTSLLYDGEGMSV